uniref:Uncharacterized protein n=1 Tax=Rhabditophanes sp. KR3021 TaxID=114890 RepID=A0AC35UCW4_9BILA
MILNVATIVLVICSSVYSQEKQLPSLSQIDDYDDPVLKEIFLNNPSQPGPVQVPRNTNTPKQYVPVNRNEEGFQLTTPYAAPMSSRVVNPSPTKMKPGMMNPNAIPNESGFVTNFNTNGVNTPNQQQLFSNQQQAFQGQPPPQQPVNNNPNFNSMANNGYQAFYNSAQQVGSAFGIPNYLYTPSNIFGRKQQHRLTWCFIYFKRTHSKVSKKESYTWQTKKSRDEGNFVDGKEEKPEGKKIVAQAESAPVAKKPAASSSNDLTVAMEVDDFTLNYDSEEDGQAEEDNYAFILSQPVILFQPTKINVLQGE